MANADIPNAKRLNPRRRRGGETLANLGYQKLSRDDISSSGKIVLKKLESLRNGIVKDANLIIAVRADTTATMELVAEYITTLRDILNEFRETPGDIDETNVADQTAIDEMVDLFRTIEH